MFEIQCYICSELFENNKLCLSHFIKNHPRASVFKCFMTNCQREYGSLKSLKSHLKICNCPTAINSISIYSKESTIDTLENFDDSAQSCASNDNLTNNVITSPININEFQKKLLKILLGIYSDQKISRKKSLEILQQMTKLYKDILLPVLSSSYEFNSIRESLDILFDAKILKSEYMFLKELTNRGLYIKSIPYTLDKVQTEFIDTDNSVKTSIILRSTQINNLREIFFQLFNKTKFLVLIIEYIEELENCPENEVHNIIQSSFWKEITEKINAEEDTLLLPLINFFDDFEPNNPLAAAYAGFL